MNKQPLISIVIPFYNDPEGLEACLKGVSHQSSHLSETEVIVVDNASTLSPKKIVDAFSFASCTYEEKPGSYAARNKGMSLAKGQYLFFIDADCIPEPNWLEQGFAILQKNKSTLVGGEISFTLSDTPSATELYQYIVGFQQEENIKDKYFSATANLFVNREDAIKIGLFEERLLSGGDRNWCWRAIEMGMQVNYCSSSIVKTKPRKLLKNAIKQTRRVAGGRFHSHILNLSESLIINDKQKPHRSNWQSIVWILTHPKLSFIQRIHVFIIAIILKAVAIIEKWQLTFGAKAERY